MLIESRSNYRSHREWFRSVLSGMDVVLSHTSALECLGLFVGYVNENQIDLYSTAPLPYDNVNCYIVDSFDGLDIVTIRGLRCTSINQTLNDMLQHYDVIDEQSLAQGLSDYYYENGQSFDGLVIDPQYADIFESFRDWAIEFYDYA
jgi:hypothetical protein